MVEVLPRRARRRADAGGRAAAPADFAELGWPVCPGAVTPRMGATRHRVPALVARGQPRGSGRACSCDRIGCPAPGAHPISAAWQIEASCDPAGAGSVALERMNRSPAVMGPVALSADNRDLFFGTTRGAPADEDEWWSCH